MFCRRKPKPNMGPIIQPKITVTPEMLRSRADYLERQERERRERALAFALGELKSGRFAFPMDDTPILLTHLLERIEALENPREDGQVPHE